METLDELSKPFQNGKALKHLSREEHSELFDHAFDELMRLLGRTQTRVGDVAIGRLYELIRKNLK